MVRLIGPVYPNLFGDLLQQLLAIYDSSVQGDSAYLFIPVLISRFQMILTKTMGYCVEALGPEVFISIVPIVVKIELLWLLIGSSNRSSFRESLLPLSVD